MKVLCVVLALVAAAQAVSLEFDREWTGFKTTYGKSYSSRQEELLRRKVYQDNKKFIEESNKKNLGFTLGINEFADLTDEEFSRRSGRVGPVRGKFQRPGAAFLFPENEDPDHLPETVDWRKHGYVTPVKNQGACGSCWSFSTTGSLEGQHFRKTGKLISLSEQNLVDCSIAEGDDGCHGGLMDDAFTYVAINGGIMSEADYPYKAVRGNCSYNPNRKVASDVSYVNLPRESEKSLRMAVATVGPVSVAIDARGTAFRFYKSGVYHSYSCSSVLLDHGVLAVGYGAEDGKDYWLVKNSWGESWGDEGYIKMSRNRDNNCGIASAASYPIV